MSDDERLAALIDGRLDERQRAELLERLALSEEDLEVLAEAGTITRELEEEDRVAAAASEATTTVIQLPARRQVSRYRGWMPIAAILAGVALGIGLWKAGPPGRRGSPVAVVDRLANADRQPPALDANPWGPKRGGADPEGFARGVRLGVRLTDLQLAARRGDPGAVQAAAASVASLLTPVPEASRELAFYKDLSKSAAPDTFGLGAHAAAVARKAGDEAVRLGAWAQAARIAAAERDAGFFADAPRELDRFAGAREVRRDAANAVRDIRADLPPDGPAGWARLSGHLDDLLGKAGQ